MAKTWTNSEVSGGKYTVALSAEIRGAIDALWHRRGDSTLNGTTGRTITLSPAESSASYDVLIQLTADPGGDVGHIWVDSKSTGNFVVKNIGSTGGAFTWVLLRQVA